MRAGALALLLTHLTAVIADVATTTPLPGAEPVPGDRAKGARRSQRGSNEGRMPSTVRWGNTVPLQKSGRTVRSSASTQPMFADARGEQVWDAEGECQEDTLEDVTVSDSSVSLRVLRDKEKVIRLSQHLGVSSFFSLILTET